jgi:galactosamine-6-phosphate isomerase
VKPKIFPDHESMSQAAATWLAQQIRQKPHTLLCLATGASPTRTYDLLAARHESSPNLFRRLRVLKLDEWGGLAMDDPATSEQHLQQHLVRPLQLGRRYTGFKSDPADPPRECKRVRNWLEHHGPIDICVLGLGTNGHLAFNEPAAFLQPQVHVARLSRTSLTHSMVKDSPVRPRYGLTMGMANILQARRVLLLVSGATKRPMLARLQTGQITSRFPASFLWLHAQALIFCDRAACSGGRQPNGLDHSRRGQRPR